MLDTVRMTQRNVKHWSSGEMGLRWTAAGMLEAERQFRNVIGYTDVPRLAVAIERHLHLPQPNTACKPVVWLRLPTTKFRQSHQPVKARRYPTASQHDRPGSKV